jgi:hypothetical protein
MENRKARQVLRVSGRWEDIRKGCRRVNVVEILCSCVCKWTNEAG